MWHVNWFLKLDPKDNCTTVLRNGDIISVQSECSEGSILEIHVYEISVIYCLKISLMLSHHILLECDVFFYAGKLFIALVLILTKGL